MTIVAEFAGGGPRDGEVRALPALLPSWEITGIDPVNAVFNGGIDPNPIVIAYDLVKDEHDEPVRNDKGEYRYEYRRPA